MSSPKPFTVIAGPCILEGENGEMNLGVAKRLKAIMESYGNDVDFYFKSSYDKANRTSNSSFRGYGVREGLDILQPPAIMFTQSGTASLFGTAIFGTDEFGALQYPVFTQNLIGSGFTGAFQFSGTDSTAPHRIDSFQVQFSQKGRR